MRARAEAGGGWSTDLLELWALLFLEHRREQVSGGIGLGFESEAVAKRDQLCLAFAQEFQAVVDASRAIAARG